MKDVSREQILQEAAHIHGMLQTPGWAVLKDEAKERIIALTERLIWANDPAQIRDLQANIRSLEFLLKFPDELLEAGRRATEEQAQAEASDPAPQE